MSQYYDMDKGKTVGGYINDSSSTSGYSSTNSPPTSVTLSPAHSPETMLKTEFANLNLPSINQHTHIQSISYQLMPGGNFGPAVGNFGPVDGNTTNTLLNSGGTNTSNIMNMDHYYATTQQVSVPFGHVAVAMPMDTYNTAAVREYNAVLKIAEQPVEKFRFRYKSEMHGTHGSLNGANSKRTPKTFPEVELLNYKGPAVIRCSLFQTNLDSPHSHQLVVRKDERDVCDPHDLHVSHDRGYVAQFINMGIIHTAKKYIFDELLKKKQDRLVFKMGRRELSTKQIQELHQETEREAKDMNLNQVRLCFEAFKIESNNTWTPIAAPVYSNAINNRKSAQTGELRIVRLSKPTGGVMGNDELILLVEKVSKKNIKVRFFEENDDGETVWEAYAKFRESDVHHQYAIVCQTPPYKNKDVDREVSVCIELIRPSDDERSYPPLPFRYKPREAIVSRKRRRTCSIATSSSSSSSSAGSAANSFELPKPVQQHGAMGHVQTISQEFGRSDILDQLVNSTDLRHLCEQDSAELEKICLMPDLVTGMTSGILQEDGHDRSNSTASAMSDSFKGTGSRNSSSSYLGEIFKIFEQARRVAPGAELYESARKKIEQLFTDHAVKNDNNDTLLHEVISQKQDNLKLAIKTFQVMNHFGLQELANSVLNADGDSGLHVACQHDRSHYIRPLLSLGCNANQQNHAGNTALHLAVKEEHFSCIDSFLNGPSAKLDLSLKNDDGLTPLHMAIRQNKYDVAKKLINYDRSSINVSNTKDGNNALHMAVLEQNVELLVLILDAQNLTDIMLARNAAGYTPLELARLKASKCCVKLLEEVHPDKGELAMTWIPRGVKEEVDSSSAEDDDESNDALFEIKSEELHIKVEPEEEEEKEKLSDDSTDSLKLLLNDANKFKRLAALLNGPSAHSAQLPKWKQLANEAKINHLVFLWSTAEGMLNYIQNKSSNIEYKCFARALQAVDDKALDVLTRN